MNCKPKFRLLCYGTIGLLLGGLIFGLKTVQWEPETYIGLLNSKLNGAMGEAPKLNGKNASIIAKDVKLIKKAGWREWELKFDPKRGILNDDRVPIPKPPGVDCDVIRNSTRWVNGCGLEGTVDRLWPMLITGTPRSGTTLMSTVLLKLDIPFSPDWRVLPAAFGTSSWMMAFSDPKPFGPMRLKRSRFATVVHQTRDPLKSITSISCTEPLELPIYADFLRRHIPFKAKSRVEAGMIFWYHWNDFIENVTNIRYQVEDWQHNIRIILQLAGITDVPTQAEIDKRNFGTVNSRKRRPSLTWDELFTVKKDLALKIWHKAALYGYNYNFNITKIKVSPKIPVCSKNEKPLPDYASRLAIVEAARLLEELNLRQKRSSEMSTE